MNSDGLELGDRCIGCIVTHTRTHTHTHSNLHTASEICVLTTELFLNLVKLGARMGRT